MPLGQGRATEEACVLVRHRPDMAPKPLGTGSKILVQYTTDMGNEAGGRQGGGGMRHPVTRSPSPASLLRRFALQPGAMPVTVTVVRTKVGNPG